MEKKLAEYKVAIQLSANDILVQKSTVRQVNNILKAIEKISIEVVTHGPGIELLLKGSPLKNNLELLHGKGVAFLICQNTLADKKMPLSAFIPFCKVVPSGVAHIIIRQSEGWSYIKAGF